MRLSKDHIYISLTKFIKFGYNIELYRMTIFALSSGPGVSGVGYKNFGQRY